LALGLLGILGFVALVFGLGWAAGLTGGGADGGLSGAYDVAAQRITVPIDYEPPELDSSKVTDQVSNFVIGHTMEGLLRYDEHNELAPGVAERWEIGERTARFYLRESARWSDGKPVTADDFVFAWQTVVDPKTASEYSFILFPIKNAEAITAGKLPPSALGVRAVDARTLEVTFERPLLFFDKLAAFGTYSPIRRDFHQSRGGRYGADAEDMLYNGPYRITRWVHGAHLRLEKNPYYWNKDQVKLNIIDMPYFTNESGAQTNLFRDGRVAAIGTVAGLPKQTIDEGLVQRWQLQRHNDGSVYFIEFNHRPGKLTANRNFRRAIQLAMDSDEVVYRVMKLPGMIPGKSLFPVWIKGVHAAFRKEYPVPIVRLDVAKARESLELARRELGLERFPPIALLSTDTPTNGVITEFLQRALQDRLGLEVRIDKQIFKQQIAKRSAGQFDMTIAGWSPDFDDPLTFGDLYASWNENNRGRYSNPELDRQVRIAQSSVDQKVRMDAFGKVQEIIVREAALVPIYERGSVYTIIPELKGVVRRAVGPDPDYTHAYLEEKQITSVVSP
jgi:oligopeptide transport system substrate-binding protein